jgi:hypothetical protein
MTIHWTKIPVKVANFTGHDLIKSTKENSVVAKDIVVVQCIMLVYQGLSEELID